MKIADAFLSKSISTKRSFLNIYYSFRPMYYISKFVGLFAASVKVKNEQAFIKPHKTDWIYVIIFSILYFGLQYYTSLAMYNEDKRVFKISEQLLFANYYLWMGFVHLVIIISFMSRGLVALGLNLLSQIDITFLKYGYSINHRATTEFCRKLIYAASISILIRCCSILFTIKIDYIQQFTIFLTSLIKAMSKYLCVVFVHMLKIRFGKIIDIIEDIQEEKLKLQTVNIKKGTGWVDIREKLYVLCRLHFKLCNVLRIWMKSFAFQQLMSLFISLCNILFHSYYLYYILAGRTDTDVLSLCQPILWLIDEAMEVYILIAVCEDTCENANKAPLVLHELRNNFYNLELESQIQVYSLQLLHQKIEFSVLGFFEIDYSLIYSIIGAVTTYLVIFIQFDQSQTSQDSIGNSSQTEVLSHAT